ncbi:hypothetical protein ANAPRD1_01369 [Anaplasma phagocytophilum]|nr:hypothetical protein ANAPRD1_01369 [Anaplasma phagocytophilum]
MSFEKPSFGWTEFVGAFETRRPPLKSRGVDLHFLLEGENEKNVSGRKVHFCVVAFRQSKTFASPMNTGAIQ